MRNVKCKIMHDKCDEACMLYHYNNESGVIYVESMNQLMHLKDTTEVEFIPDNQTLDPIIVHKAQLFFGE